MHMRSQVHVVFGGMVLIGALLLAGCPKRPEVIQAAPAPAGPAAAAVPAPAPAPAPAPLPVAPAPEPPKVVETPVAPTPAPAPAPVAPAPAPAPAPPAPAPLKDVFFDYDKANIRDDQKAALNDNVGWLKGNTGAKLLVEGHCDERGTAEYNLALGERRAKAVKDYLIAAGVAADRVSTISYGKERPFVLGHDESAWKWNRRAHFVLQGQ
jgi:peptidoglycan-associated lipoprotein